MECRGFIFKGDKRGENMARVFKKDKKSADWWIDYNNRFGRRRREKVGPNHELAVQVLGERLKRVTQEKEICISNIE